MRILFLGLTTHEHLEYNIHEWLARNANPEEYQSIFFRQTADKSLSQFKIVEEPGPVRHYYADFGRNMSIEPQPSHWKRGMMLALRSPSGMAFLLKKVREFQPDFIYTSQQHLDCFYALALRKLTGVPHIMHLHYFPGPWLGKMTMEALRSTPYLISVSEFAKQGALKCGISPENVRIVYNGLMQDSDATPRDRAWLCQTFNVPINARVIVAAGRLDPEKRHEYTIQAMAKVKDAFPEAYLLICGSSIFSEDYPQSLKKLAAELGLGERVIFTGHRRDLPRILASSDIFCLPSINEAFGLVYIEAMNEGLPVIAVESGAVSEIVRHGETGLISPPDDLEPLANNLIYLLNNPETASRLGQAGRERAARLFSSQRFIQNWTCAVQDCYSAAIARNPVIT